MTESAEDAYRNETIRQILILVGDRHDSRSGPMIHVFAGALAYTVADTSR
jgi:hypothetical protein